MASIQRRFLLGPAAALTGNNTSDAVSLDNADTDFIAYIAATAVGVGTSLVVKIQHSADGINWFDVAGATFTALTAAGSELKIPTSNLLGQVRTVATFTGGATTATLGVSLSSRAA